MLDRLYREEFECDVCVIGGGMAGLCAAVAAARHGARTVLLHDRPVLGGNASSEVRMWICGAHGKHNKETGILEEVQLDNQFLNPDGNWSVWDATLWSKAVHQPGLTLLANTSCTDAEMDGDRIAAVKAWGLTSQTLVTVRAKQYVDCSGDSILAPVTGADFRMGREARGEFGEDIEPVQGDARTMGNSLLIQIRKTDSPQPFTAPDWAYKFESPQDLPNRMKGVQGGNWWWIEVGGLRDTIRDAEAIRDELMRVAWGVWDYVKNRAPERKDAENWALEWIGSLPGKRESRRYVGAHVLTQNDVSAGGKFDDVVAYGGWTMDDHHPGGIYYPGRPTEFHPAPSPFGIPYRSLYSRNVSNLLFAGRNISTTHAALSATRVMGTCAILGQAAGTAAALCVEKGCLPRELYPYEVPQLQASLMDDDSWLPGITRTIDDIARAAALRADGMDSDRLLDGLDRDREGESHAWIAPPGSAVEFSWTEKQHVGGLRAVFDSDLNQTKRMPCSYPHKFPSLMPAPLAKVFRVEVLDDAGQWTVAKRVVRNRYRLVKVPLGVATRGVRLVIEEAWGGKEARVFAAEPVESMAGAWPPPVPEGPSFSAVRAAINPDDLKPPAKEAKQ
jgi:hypothetical protein